MAASDREVPKGPNDARQGRLSRKTVPGLGAKRADPSAGTGATRHYLAEGDACRRRRAAAVLGASDAASAQSMVARALRDRSEEVREVRNFRGAF